MSKLSNILTMIELLSTGKKYSVEELANIIEVTPRMIRAYKEDMEKAGIYVDTIYGPYGGYVLQNQVRIPKRSFKVSDYEFLNNLEVSNEDREKLNIIADKVRGIYLGSKLENIEVSSSIKNTYNIIAKAIKEHRKVLIDYYSYTKGITTRTIDPYDLFLYSSGWGVAAYCNLRHDLRHFELKRIDKIELLDEFFWVDQILPT